MARKTSFDDIPEAKLGALRRQRRDTTEKSRSGRLCLPHWARTIAGGVFLVIYPG
jgi:hypothetical protein